MSTDIARRTEGSSLVERMEYAKALAVASLLPRVYQQNPGNVLLAMELGDALGIRPIQAINAVHVIEGKPSASADLIASLVRKAGHKLRVSGDDLHATAQIIRADDPDYTFEATWTIERAKAAGLTGKTNWKSYPAAMLKARAITEVARAGASDALYGVIYTPEELGAEVDEMGEVVSRAVPVRRGGMAGLRDAVAPKAEEPVDADIVEDTPQTGDGGGSQEETSVAEGRAGSIPAGNAPPSSPQTGDAAAPAPTGGVEVSPTPPLAAASPDLIPPAGKQMKALHAALNEQGLDNREAGLEYLSEVVGRTLTTSKELTVAEASRCIDLLKAVNEDPFGEPPEEPM